MTTRTLSLQLEEDFTTHTAALFVSHVNVFQSTIRIIAGERSINAKSLRLLLIPVFCYLYLAKEAYHWAAGVVLLSSLTDLFDGMIARKFNMITNLGKALDPIADKLTHGALALCLAFRYPQMWVLFGLMVLKEGYMVVMGLLFLRKGKMLNLKIS